MAPRAQVCGLNSWDSRGNLTLWTGCQRLAGHRLGYHQQLQSLWPLSAPVWLRLGLLFPSFLEEGQILFEEFVPDPATFCSTGGLWRELLCAGARADTHTL